MAVRSTSKDKMHLSAVGVGANISFTHPRLEGSHVRQDTFAGEIEIYDEDRSGTSMKIILKLKGQERIFTLRPDYEISLS